MNEEPVGLKLLLSYEVLPESLQEYRLFIMRQYIPVMQELGFQMSEAWHTAYGEAPNRLIGFVCRDEVTMSSLLENATWQDLNEKLSQYVVDFTYKVVPYRGAFQI